MLHVLQLLSQVSAPRLRTRPRSPHPASALVPPEGAIDAPIGNAELWFMALKKQGVPAEFVRYYPRSNHDLSRTGEPWLLVDRLSRRRQWFTYWLMEKPGGAVQAGKVK